MSDSLDVRLILRSVGFVIATLTLGARRTICLLLAVATLGLTAAAVDAGEFHGTATKFDRDQCFVLDRFPEDSGAQYKSKDADQEQKLCKVDFRDKNIGLCPKTWSTSPGTVVYDIGQSKYAGKPEVFENEFCPTQRRLKDSVPGVQKIASYKQSVNGQFNQRTSATFSQASPLYYHFSRYLNATVDVPVAVMRTMAAQDHYRRVTTRAKTLVSTGMIANGWTVVSSAEKNPAGYVPTSEFYYGSPADGMIYGMMAKSPGTRYGPEFNGNISGKGYTDEYTFWQKTPAFLALASRSDLSSAIDSALTTSRSDPVVARALGRDVSHEQMVLWMKDMSDIFVLDYIFNQQDRPGNVDYQWVWYYVDANNQLKTAKVDSEVSRSRMDSIAAPPDIKSSSRHFLMQKTQLGDNDAGGRRYTNFTKKFGLLEKLHHMSTTTYRQLIKLARDYQAKGPLYNYLRNTFDLAQNYVDDIAQNTIDAANILKTTCKSGTMKFDLDPDSYIATGKAADAHLDCENP